MEKVVDSFADNWNIFSKACQSDIEILSNESLNSFKNYLLRKEYETVESIASCVFLTGVNTPDLDYFINHVCKIVVDDCQGYFSSTHGMVQINNSRTMIEKLVEQLDLEEDPSLQIYPSVQRSLYGLNERIKSKTNINSGPIVFLVSNLDSLTNETLNDFIDICANYRINERHLKSLVLVFNISTTLDIALTSRLNSNTSSRIDITLFQTPSPVVFVNHVVEKLMSHCGMKLNANSLVYLIDDLMLCLDYSVKNLLKRIKFILLQTLIKYPQFFYLTCGDRDKIKYYLNSLSGKEFQSLIRSFGSLTNLINEESIIKELTKDDRDTNNPPKLLTSPQSRRTMSQPAKGNMLTKCQTLNDIIMTQIETNWRMQLRAPIVIKWLSKIIHNPNHNSVKERSISDLYLYWLEGKLAQPQFIFENIFPSINNLSDEEISKNISNALNFLRESQIAKAVLTFNNDEKCRSYLQDLILSEWNREGEMNNLLKLLNLSQEIGEKYREKLGKPNQESEMELTSEDLIKTNPKVVINPIRMPLNRKMSMKSLKEQLEELKLSTQVTKTSQNTLLDELKGLLIGLFKSDRGSLLPPIRMFGFHEAFYPAHRKDLEMVKKNLNPDFQATIHRDLLCTSKRDSDFSIIYKLHCEYTGTLVNLYDWLHAFNSLVTGEDVASARELANEDNKENTEVVDGDVEGEEDDEEASDDPKDTQIATNVEPTVIIRFFNALATMNHLGLIKLGKERKDMITRLTWNIGT